MNLTTNGNCVGGGVTNVKMTNFRLLFYYAAPYFAYVAVGMLVKYLSVEGVYALRLILVPAILVWAWRWYRPLTGPKSPYVSTLVGILIGVLGTLLWVLLLAPFAEKDAVAWTEKAIYLRTAASSLIVPIFEEFFMRGFVFLFIMQWDLARKKGIPSAFEVTLHEGNIADVQDISWNLPAILISAAVFTLGHQVAEWPASIAYGLLMAILFIIRKDLLSCVVAHGTTNLCLAIYVSGTESWGYW